jgi:O-antigen/teichoic acid export membrane protein
MADAGGPAELAASGALHAERPEESVAGAMHAEARMRRSVLFGTAGTVVLNSATIVLNFAVALVLARTLGTAGYGAYAFALAWASILAMPASLGLGPLVLRHVASYAEHGSWGLLRGLVRRANQVVAASATLIVLGAAVVGWLLPESSSELLGPFLIGLLLVPLIALTSLRQAAVQGLHRVVLGRIPDTLVLPGVFLALVVVAADRLGDRFDAEWATSLNVAAGLVAFIVGAVLLRALLPTQVRTAVPEYDSRAWVRGGLALLGLALLLVVNVQVGTILLGALDGADSAGTYSVASRIAMFTSFFFLAATYPLYPNVARLWAIGDTGSMQRVLTRASRVVLAISSCIAAALLVLAPQVLEVFGAEFAGGATALRILVLGQLIAVAAGFGGLALVMTPHEGSMALGTGLGVALNIVLTAALIPVWGVNGAALAYAAGSLVAAALVAWLAWRRLGVYAPAVGRPPSRSSRVS